MTKKPKARRTPGLGTVRELPSGNWRWEVMVEARRFSGTARTKKDAQTAISTQIADAARGGVVDPSQETVGDYLERWLRGKEKRRAVRTNEIQRGHLERHVRPSIGHKRLQRLSPADLRRLFDDLNDKGLGASSQRQVHQFLISALGEAFRLELVTRNVAEIVKPSPARGKEEKVLPAFTPEEAARFVEVAREGGNRGELFIFAMSTGMRRGEVCGLRWADVDLSKGTAEVQEVVAQGDEGVLVTTPKTHGSRRTVYLSPSAVQLLKEVRTAQEGHKARLALPVPGHGKGYQRKRPWADSGRVFTNEFGGTLDPHNLRRDMLMLCQRAEVRPLTIHGLRHTYASLSLMRGVPIEVVSKQLGHSSVAFTLSQYRWVYREERERWALGLGDLLAPQK